MNEEWDALTRKTERNEKRLGRLEACGVLSGAWYAELSSARSDVSKVLFSSARGRVVRIGYYLITSSSVTVEVTLSGETLSFSHAAGNPSMTLMLPLLEGNNQLRLRVSAGAAGVSRGGVSAEQWDIP